MPCWVRNSRGGAIASSPPIIGSEAAAGERLLAQLLVSSETTRIGARRMMCLPGAGGPSRRRSLAKDHSMTLDLFTVLITAAFTLAVAGALLLISWWQNPDLRALGLWAASFSCNAIGVALVAYKGALSETWWAFVTGAILAASHGLMWAGARSFERRSTPVPLTLAGTLTWLVACQFAEFYQSPAARVTLMSTIIVAYSVLSAIEFWCGRGDGQLSRWLIMPFLLCHALIFLIRIPFGGSLRLSIQRGDIEIDWMTFIFFEIIFYAFFLAYMLGSMAKERVAHSYRQASLTDPLTGVSNRRDFLERCEALLHRTTLEHHSSALLLFDLDDFKSINDTHGHHVGDRLLIGFCRVARSVLRPNDIFGRLGGEEFGCFVPRASLADGREIAERIRMKFEVAPAPDNALKATVSAGVAAAADRRQDLGALLLAADRALYRAKANGRNRV